MADISITAASVAASNQATIRREYPFGAAVGAGQIVYLDSNNRWQLAGGTIAAASAAIANGLFGIALCNGANTQPASVCTADPALTVGGTLANSVAYFGSTNVGAITATATPSANYPMLLGVAKSTTQLNFNPTGSLVVV